MDVAEGTLRTCSPLRRLVVLLAAANEGEPIRGMTRLQNIMFMLTEEDGEGHPYGYSAGDLGPRSDAVDEEIRCLVEEGILRTDGEDISITRLGNEVAGRIAGGEDRLTLIMIDDHKDMFNDLTIDELLAYVYSAYPDMAAGPVAHGLTAADRERHIMSMLKKEKITSGCAAELLGRPREYIWRLTGRMRVRMVR